MRVPQAFVGGYVTGLETAGASLTVMQLDDALQALLDHPAHPPLCTRVAR